MKIDLSQLNENQKNKILSLYYSFIEKNNITSQHRKSVFISKDELQKKLFEERNLEGDVYMDIDSKKYGSMTSFDEDNCNIVNWKENKIISKFTYKDFIPCCDHLPEEIINELNSQIGYSTGGNYMRWNDLHEELEEKPDSLLGYHTIESNLTFYGMYGTNDCNWPVFFILYYDGENIRGYVPLEGNQFCQTENISWGQECNCFDSEEEREKHEEKLLNKSKNFTYFDYAKLKEDILKNISLVQ